MPRLLRALPFLVAAGCAASGDNFASSDAATTTASDGTDETDVTSTLPDSGAAAQAPAWYALDAQLRILAGGDIDPAASTVQVGLWSEDLVELCVQDVPILDAAAVTPPDTEAVLLAWWELDLDDGAAGGDCDPWPSRTVRLGFGVYDGRLDAAVAQHGWDGSTLLGFYVEETSGGPLYVVGVAGTTGMFAGAELPVEEPPLAEGRYDARTLLLLPL